MHKDEIPFGCKNPPELRDEGVCNCDEVGAESVCPIHKRYVV